MWCNLAMASYTMGIHGIIYTFPCIIALFFLKPIKTSITISLISISFFLSLTLVHGDELINLRIMASMVLTVAFTAFFAYSSRFQQRALDSELRRDPLTGMRNRYAFNEWLEECKKSSEINTLTIIQLDLDNFKIINDTLGFDVGDRVLKEIATQIQSLIQTSPIRPLSSSIYKARCSGDVFIIGIANLRPEGDVNRFTTSLQQIISQLTLTDDHSVQLTSSIGVVHELRKSGEFLNLIGNADIALRKAKKHGKNNIVVFNEAFSSILGEQKNIALEISKALQHNEFHMVFMPIYKHNSTSIIGAELLLRSDRTLLKTIGPDKYIPVAEYCGLINQIDFWVLNESFKIIAATPMLTISSVEFYSINISSHQLHNKDFIPHITGLINTYKITPNLIKLEITETSLIEADLKAIDTLVMLKRLGFHLSLDDYGTGFTSFNQLKKYPLDSLKIDKSFVSGDAAMSTNQLGMAGVIISIAKLYDYKVIAEGVETQEQYLMLKDIGCQYFQGYLFSKPLNLKEFMFLLSHNSH